MKKILLLVLPVLLVTITVSVALFLRHRSIRNKTESLLHYMESGEEYLAHNNYQKAKEEYGEARQLADSLRREQAYEEADQYMKLAEQVILADETLAGRSIRKPRNCIWRRGECPWRPEMWVFPILMGSLAARKDTSGCSI